MEVLYIVVVLAVVPSVLCVLDSAHWQTKTTTTRTPANKTLVPLKVISRLTAPSLPVLDCLPCISCRAHQSPNELKNNSQAFPPIVDLASLMHAFAFFFYSLILPSPNS